MSELDPTYNLTLLPTPNVLGAPDSFVPKYNLLSRISRVGFGLLAAGTSLMITEAETAEASSPMSLSTYCADHEDGSRSLMVEVYINVNYQKDTRVEVNMNGSGVNRSGSGYLYGGYPYGTALNTGVLKAGSINVAVDFPDIPDHHQGGVQGKDCTPNQTTTTTTTTTTSTTAPATTTSTTEAPSTPPPTNEVTTTTFPRSTSTAPRMTTTTRVAPETPKQDTPTTTTIEAGATSSSTAEAHATTTTENNEVAIIDIDNDESDNASNKSSNGRSIALLGVLIAATTIGIASTLNRVKKARASTKAT